MQGIARLRLLGAQVRAGLAELTGNGMLSGDCCAPVYCDSAGTAEERCYCYRAACAFCAVREVTGCQWGPRRRV